MQVLLFQINLNKIEKEQLFKTDKGIYLSGAIVIREELDQYGNKAFITQRIKQEGSLSGVNDPIIGNAKPVPPKKGPEPVTDTDIDNLPF